MTKTCEICKTEFDSQRHYARFCSGRCRARAHRAGISQPRPGSKKKPKPEPKKREPVNPDGLLEAVRAELDAAGVTGTAAGQHALELATRIVNAPPLNTGVAAISKQLQSVMADALGPADAAAAAPMNPLDELKARRDRKRSAH